MTTSSPHLFYNESNELQLEAVNIASIAAQVGTPCYLYSKQQLQDNLQSCTAAFSSRNINIHYAMKANSNLNILSIIANAGLGADIVSHGELVRAIEAGFVADSIIFSGVGKTTAELNAAMDANVGQFNIESAEELQLLAQLAEQRQQKINAVLRINPEIEVDTHRHITTGSKGNKFGIAAYEAISLFEQLSQHRYLQLTGLAMHIGSQIQSTAPYRTAIQKLMQLAAELEQRGHSIDHLDLGGGFGIDYGDGQQMDLVGIANEIRQLTQGFKGRIAVEPGRSIVGNIGILVSQVSYLKQAQPRPFLILDAGMNDLMRPALYQAKHPLLPTHRPNSAETITVDVVGPVCESTDRFSQNERIDAAIAQGDYVVLTCAGAYSAVMSNSYNSRSITAEALIDGTQATLIRQPITASALLNFERPQKLAN